MKVSQNHFHFLGVNSWILEIFWETLKRLENPWKPLTENWRKNFGCLGCKPCWTGHVGRPYNDPGWKPRVCTLVGSSYEGRGVSLSWIDLQDIHIRKRATPILTLRETLCDPKKRVNEQYFENANFGFSHQSQTSPQQGQMAMTFGFESILVWDF